MGQRQDFLPLDSATATVPTSYREIIKAILGQMLDTNPSKRQDVSILNESFCGEISNTFTTLFIDDPIQQWEHMSENQRKQFERKLVRKLDQRLIPWFMLVCLISFLDVKYTGNAQFVNVLLFICRS